MTATMCTVLRIYDINHITSKLSSSWYFSPMNTTNSGILSQTTFNLLYTREECMIGCGDCFQTCFLNTPPICHWPTRHNLVSLPLPHHWQICHNAIHKSSPMVYDLWYSKVCYCMHTSKSHQKKIILFALL